MEKNEKEFKKDLDEWQEKVIEEEKEEFKDLATQTVDETIESMNTDLPKKEIIKNEDGTTTVKIGPIDKIPGKEEKDLMEIQEQQHLDLMNKKEDAYKMSKYLWKNKLLPESIKTHQEAFVSLQTAMALGYQTYGNMILAIKNMYFVNGQVELFGDLPLAVVEKSGKLEYIREFFVDKEHQEICLKNKNLDKEILSAICIVKRTDKEEKEFHLTERDLKISGGKPDEHGGWSFKKKGNYESITWKKYPKIHWTRRLRAFALKSTFPDVLKGVEIHEYDGMKYDHTVSKEGLQIPYKEEKTKAEEAYSE